MAGSRAGVQGAKSFKVNKVRSSVLTQLKLKNNCEILIQSIKVRIKSKSVKQITYENDNLNLDNIDNHHQQDHHCHNDQLHNPHTKDLQGVSNRKWVIVITVQLAGVLPRVLIIIMIMMIIIMMIIIILIIIPQ